MIKIYIACPYTKGDVAVNVKKSIDAAGELFDLGFNVFNPLSMSHFQHMMHPKNYNHWMKVDYDWIGSCDAILRLPGLSEGADMETEYAEKRGIPVFTDIVDVEYFFKNAEK